jgi:hypothetical protein
MTKTLIFLAVMAGINVSATSQAALIDRGSGMIYDSDQDITWLMDSNYAAAQYASSGGSLGDADGKMNWYEAMNWVNSLSYGGYDDWRLPVFTGTGSYTGIGGCKYSGSDCGFNSLPESSEFAYMYYVNLGNLALFDANGQVNQPPWGLANTSYFINISQTAYWTSTAGGWGIDPRWHFDMQYGSQGYTNAAAEFGVWAVRDGDVPALPALPEPATLMLLFLGTVEPLAKPRIRV